MKKHHFDAFRHEKHFEKQLQLHSQTGLLGEIILTLYLLTLVLSVLVLVWFSIVKKLLYCQLKIFIFIMLCRLGRYAVESYLEQILSHGFFHADPVSLLPFSVFIGNWNICYLGFSVWQLFEKVNLNSELTVLSYEDTHKLFQGHVRSLLKGFPPK